LAASKPSRWLAFWCGLWNLNIALSGALFHANNPAGLGRETLLADLQRLI
jgi:hypothetical protein